SFPQPIGYPSTVITCHPLSPFACNVSPFKYDIISGESQDKSNVCLTSFLLNESASAWEGSNLFFLNVPKCHPGRNTFKPSISIISEGMIYRSLPNKIKSPSGVDVNVSFAN